MQVVTHEVVYLFNKNLIDYFVLEKLVVTQLVKKFDHLSLNSSTHLFF
jgi:hypothetical protein